MNPSPYRPGCNAAEAHAALRRSLAALKLAEEHSVLWFADIQRRRLFSELGYGSMIVYAVEALGFSRARAYAFRKLAQRLDGLPRTRKAVEEGRLPWTKAREVARVADPESEVAWLKLADEVGQRQLRKTADRAQKTAAAAPAAQPALLPSPASPPAVTDIVVTFRLTPVQKETLEHTLEALRRRGETGSREELLVRALQSFVANDAPLSRTPATTIVIRQCPDCGTAEVGDHPVPSDELAAAHCDAIIQTAGRNRATIAPSLRRRVLARDRHRCTRPGCGSRRHLQVHHLVPRTAGGPNTLGNLTTLCGSCHRQVHRLNPATSPPVPSPAPAVLRPEQPP